jgi:hypothetical protein
MTIVIEVATGRELSSTMDCIKKYNDSQGIFFLTPLTVVDVKQTQRVLRKFSPYYR